MGEMPGSERLRAAAGHARMIFQRVSTDGSVLEQMERGEWDRRLTPAEAEDVAAVFAAAAEHARFARALAGNCRATTRHRRSTAPLG